MDDETSNTGKRRKPGTFTKNDPRINRKGRPKNFDQLRAIALEIAAEQAKGRGGEPIIIDGREVTIAEAIMRQWAASPNPALQMKFVELTFGKVPNIHEIESKNGTTIEVKVRGRDE